MLFYKVITPIGSVVVRSTCRNPYAPGICHCYKKYETHKTMSMCQWTEYQLCRNKQSKNKKNEPQTLICANKIV